jgi:AraC family ethanolamine operon transcriptional activator
MNDRRSEAETGVFSTEDPVLYEAAIQPWELSVDMRRSSLFRCEIRYLRLDGMTVYRDRYDHDMRLQGMTPPNTLTIALPNGGLTDDSAFWGRSIDPNGVYPTFCSEIDSVTAQNHDQYIILIDTDFDHGPEFDEIFDRFDTRKGPLLLASECRRRLQHLCCSALSLTADVDTRNAEFLHSGLRFEMIRAICETFLDGPSVDCLIVGQREISAISTMFEFMMSHYEPVTTVGHVCSATGINERTLERAVRAKFDCTVHSFLRRQRMHEARRRLLFSDRQKTSVTEIAYELGFFDCGRFAGDYRRRFGELPSSTLHNSKIDKVEPLFV